MKYFFEQQTEFIDKYCFLRLKLSTDNKIPQRNSKNISTNCFIVQDNKTVLSKVVCHIRSIAQKFT